jgi:hypothetical protein
VVVVWWQKALNTIYIRTKPTHTRRTLSLNVNDFANLRKIGSKCHLLVWIERNEKSKTCMVCNNKKGYRRCVTAAAISRAFIFNASINFFTSLAMENGKIIATQCW